MEATLLHPDGSNLIAAAADALRQAHADRVAYDTAQARTVRDALITTLILAIERNLGLLVAPTGPTITLDGVTLGVVKANYQHPTLWLFRPCRQCGQEVPAVRDIDCLVSLAEALGTDLPLCAACAETTSVPLPLPPVPTCSPAERALLDSFQAYLAWLDEEAD